MTPPARPRRPLTLRLLLPLLPALSTVLLLAVVLWANDRIVAQDLAQRAQFRVTQNAALFADQVARVLARRTAELELLAPVITLAPGPAAEHLRAMQRLQDTSASYAGIALFDAQGRLLLATGDARRLAPWSPAAADGPRLLPTDAVPPAPGAAPLLTVIVVPAHGASGQPPGHLVALLARPYFENLRQFALGDPAARRRTTLSLRTADGTALLGPTRPAAGDEFALAEHAVQTPDSHLVTGWTVTALQPIDAAQGPALRLQQGLLLWGLTAALLIGGAGLWLSRRIARPYNELLDAVAHSSTPQGPHTPGAYLQSVRAALQRLHPAEPTGLPSDPLLAGLLQDALRLQTVIDELPSPVYLLGPDQRVTYWNRQAERVFGWTAAQAVGQPIAQLLPGDLPQHPERDGASPVEVRTQHRDGAELWCEWRLLALHDAGGQTTGQVALVRDVTERVHAASALAQHQIELSELTQRLLEQEQRTSRQLAQTLHDQLGQTLGAIRLAYDALAPLWQAAEPGRQQQRAQALGQMIARANGEVRQALIELRPPLLHEEGLAMALDNELHLRRADADPVQLVLHTDDAVVDQRWSPDVEYAAFMIAREAVTNALRHAGATQVQVQLGGDARRLSLRIRDDGIGLAEELHAGRPGHLGLVGIRERALAIGALVEFLPAHPQGLVIALRWPASPTMPLSDLPHPPTP